ncbi:BA14K family protein [Nitratireductor mangrovi]|nr:BA14K family protein [Nitratireductor mangrovi]
MKTLFKSWLAGGVALAIAGSSIVPAQAASMNFAPRAPESAVTTVQGPDAFIRRHRGGRNFDGRDFRRDRREFRREFRRDRREARRDHRRLHRRGDHFYLNGHRGYRHRRPGYREYDGWWFPAAAFIAGAIITGAINDGPRTQLNEAHVDWCFDRYRSYRLRDNSFQPYEGPRRQCISPYY